MICLLNLELLDDELKWEILITIQQDQLDLIALKV